jgi:purine-binding chemotaxis protein CheW
MTMGTADETQVLTFTLGDEDYCVDIDYVAEIVDGGDMTSIPDSDPHVEGVMDLRGRTTTIVNPCELLNTGASELVADGGAAQNRIVVLDSETVDTDTTTGWLVSGVDVVTSVTEDDLEAETVGDTDLLRGLVKDEDGFTMWLDPHEFVV